MLKIAGVWGVLACVLLVNPARALGSAEQEAENLLVLLHMDAALQQSIEQMIDGEIEQNNDLRPFRSVLRTFFTKYMGFENLKADIIQMYTSSFSAAELARINTFYRSPEGQKFLQITPDVMAKSTALGEQRMQLNLPEFQQMVDAEVQRRQTDKSPPNTP